MNKYVLDKNNRPIEKGDILKVFHFIGARRKKYFMYKQVMGYQPYHPNNFYQVSHLNMKNMDENDSNYPLGINNQKEEDIEIVQSSGDDFENRPKLKPENND